jgi:hypothetical protein
MAMPEHDDLGHLDIGWLANDSAGHVAVFTTAGEGPIPRAAVPSHEVAEAFVHQLQETSDHRLLASMPDPSDFISFAKRGFFAYDWCDTRGYELVAVPDTPAKLSELPGHVRDIANLVKVETAFGVPVIERSSIAI